ncbi:TetR/AcrR family transcriptional regulator [Actinomycetospora termitidis]|uniref:TetR/AcrR family transcriptional regulator n=1 Tax=Actinomycetospora termitidis TaxID=3053470 RepID=A0ABT7MID2_9PSEU|nr:TetR/AcrR family transcriptional regulator [Actinomycetospora sp. Odt1-22]MDL5159073.1 TetR/AcrR family transcriptional regulator [Actinomycetospora sp. Odt1-22]
MSEPVPLSGRRRVTPEQIVDAAAALFAREGYHAVGTRDIADELGIRGASLYHHYRSKEEILAAICRRVTAEPVEETLPLLDDAGTPGSRLAALVRAHLHHLVRRRVEFLVGLQELAALSPEHRAEVEEHRRHYQRRVRDTVAAGVRSGEFAVDDPGLAALALLDAVNGTARWLRPEGPRSPDAVADVYVRLLVDGLLGRDVPDGG